MKVIYYLIFLSIPLFFIFECSQQESNPQNLGINTLTEAEKEGDWQLLFNGSSMTQWRGVGKENFPDKGWTIENGLLIVNKGGSDQAERGGDIITNKTYGSFDFKFDFRLTEKSNGGIKYFVKEYTEGQRTWAIGCEYQIIDDSHQDLTNDKDKKRMLASLYELFEPQNRPLRPIGEWNQGRILVEGKHVEHWLNGTRVLAYERGSEQFERARLASKFDKYPEFGILEKGHILLQDHGDEVQFRNLNIKEL